MRLLYDNYQPATGRSTYVEVDDETGLPVVVQAQDTQPIVESAKAIASSFDPWRRTEVQHVARIPLVIWQRLNRLGITKDPAAFRAWLNSREARLLRTDDGRIL